MWVPSRSTCCWIAAGNARRSRYWRPRANGHGSLPSLSRSLRWAAAGEMRACLEQESGSQRALERAFALLPQQSNDLALPFLMLGPHPSAALAGPCSARLGHTEAIEDLSRALEGIALMGRERAEAGLRTDFALAYSAHGDLTQDRRQARRAVESSERSGSVRPRARLSRLLGLGSCQEARRWSRAMRVPELCTFLSPIRLRTLSRGTHS